ncbi:MAG: putative aminodeoxychorismate lyase [Alphaproteobacteria bacterium ADurb.Bin438]|nr:MAG: putative aminodeoxychorismate lyase [Alphaproteobacteria bacterium ADurb.Bin438]
MPETYHYHYGVKKKEIFNRIKESMATYIDTVWDKRVSNLPFTTKEEALTLASIVERETSIPSEYPEVASVYINRLKIDMKLQADPTVIYAVSNGTAVLNRLLTLADLKIDNPYNTYVNKGLPPSPICNPGKKAIDAVLNPAETEYLFFVADGTGGHVFTKNYKDHSKKVSEWRKINKKYRASKKNSSKEPTINKNKKSTVKSNKKNVIIKDEKINKVEVKK